MKRPPFPAGPRASLNVKLALGLLAALFLVGVPFFVLFSHFHRKQLIEGLKSSTSSLSRLVVSSLESAMLRENPHLLQEEVMLLSRQSGVERIMILDTWGEVRVSSDPRTLGMHFDRHRDPTCQVCHRLGLPERQSTTIAEVPSGEVFRNMNLIMNETRCHRCHDPRDRINGILIMDLSLEPTRRQLAASMKQMLAMAGVMVFLTIGALGLLMRGLILERLQRFMRVTNLIREGELGESVPVDSADEIGRLAESFNVMTASLRGSLKELERQRQFLEDVINSIQDEILVFDREGSVVTANKAGRERRVCKAIESCAGLTGATLRTGLPGSHIEVLPNPEGRERYLECHTYPLRDKQGEVFQVIQVARDITERKHMEAHLHHSERLASLGLLASGFSHEINNPLGSISAGIEGLLRMIDKPERTAERLAEMKDYLVLIRNEVERAHSITNRLLILSRPSGGSASLIDVRKTVFDMVTLLRHRARQSGIEILETSDGAVPLVKGDEPGLRQVLLNLLLNAVEAIEGQGRIRAGVRPAEGGVEISVRDSGRGIAKQELSKVFEPFFSKRPGEQGTGLGLFIASSIVNQMGGRIEVQSEPGQGTEFRVFLPAALENPQ